MKKVNKIFNILVLFDIKNVEEM